MPKEPPYKTIVMNNDLLKGIDFIHFKYGRELFVRTMNQFLIDSGMCPGTDIPIGTHTGQFKIRGVWQAGMKFTQYEDWEDKIDEIFGVIRDDPAQFKKILSATTFRIN
jgi:hypothetical protein